jgi:hypothetical protein
VVEAEISTSVDEVSAAITTEGGVEAFSEE